MSSFGLQVFSASGALEFDTRTAEAGVVCDFLSYGAGSSDTRTYPDFAGYTAHVVNMGHVYPGESNDLGVSTDNSLGYPRVSVAWRDFPRSILVVVR